jgi:predicted acetyltransferase
MKREQERREISEIRPIRDDEVPAFRASMVLTFGGDASVDAQGDKRFRALIASGRAFAAFDRGMVVGTAATFDFTLTVPGGSVPMAGLTMVSVRPTHRRRGILRRLMELHLAEARERGIALSGLWSSETAIYGRFGYGVAAESEELSFRAPGLALPDGPADELEFRDEVAPAELAPIYDAVRKTRPGMFSRSEAWWRWMRFTERPFIAPVPSPRRHVLIRRDGVPTGYVTYRQRALFEQGLAAGTVVVDELVATDTRAELTLWRFLCSIDLFPQVRYWNAPVDSILPWVTPDRRRLLRQRTDTLWLRIEDVAAALAARTYAADGVLGLELDAQCYELRVEGGRARCAAGAPPSALRLDRATLGSLYLGGAGVSLLARAGCITGDAETLALADRMFTSPRAPWCPEIF